MYQEIRDSLPLVRAYGEYQDRKSGRMPDGRIHEHDDYDAEHCVRLGNLALEDVIRASRRLDSMAGGVGHDENALVVGKLTRICFYTIPKTEEMIRAAERRGRTIEGATQFRTLTRELSSILELASIAPSDEELRRLAGRPESQPDDRWTDVADGIFPQG